MCQRNRKVKLEITIRTAKQEDYQEIDAIFQDVNQFHAKIHPEIKEKFADEHFDKNHFIDELKDEQTTFLVAEVNEKVAGFMLGIFKTHEKTKSLTFYISKFATAKDFRGAGVGLKLMNEAEKIAKEKGCQRIELSLYSNNTSAQGFYQHLGFEPQRTILQKSLK